MKYLIMILMLMTTTVFSDEMFVTKGEDSGKCIEINGIEFKIGLMKTDIQQSYNYPVVVRTYFLILNPKYGIKPKQPFELDANFRSHPTLLGVTDIGCKDD